MYRRFNIFKVFRINYIRYRSTFNEQIFFDYRKRFVHHDLLSNVIEKIDSNISEKHSLLILTAAARYIHHVTPEKRVQLLEEVPIHCMLFLSFVFFLKGLENIE